MECTVELPVTERTDPNGAKIRSFWDKPLGVFTLKTGLNLAPFRTDPFPRAVFLWAKAQAPFFQGGWALVPGNIVPRSRGRARVWGPLKGGTPNGPDDAGR